MHSRVRTTPESLFRHVGLFLLLLALAAPLASIQPAPAAAQDAEPPAELTEVWSYEGTDFFEGNPAVANGTVLASTADSVIHAVDGATGEALWQTETGYVTRPYMQVEDGLLFTLSNDPFRLNALDLSADAPEERWSVEFPSTIQPAPARPTLTEDGLVLMMLDLGGSANWQIVAFDSEDGSEQWSVDLSATIYATGYVYADGVIVAGMEEGLTGFDAANGDELWQIDLDPMSVTLLAGDSVVFGALRESDELFALDPATGDELWNVSAPTEFNLPLTYGDGLFFVDHPLEVEDERLRGILALDAETGEERYTIASIAGEIFAGVAFNGLLYLAGDETVGQDGALEVYDSTDGTLLARNVINAVGIGVDPETGAIFANTRGDDGDLLRAYEPVAIEGAAGSDENEGGDTASGDAPLDLAAMALTPWDLADAGLENFGHGFSEMVFIDTFSANIAESREMPADEVREILDDAGFLRSYYAYFYSPAEQENVSQVVVSYIVEFADADGAVDAWEFLEDESDRDDSEDLDGFDDFGDASEATIYTGEDEATGDLYAQIDASALLGNLHVGAGVIDWNGDEPDEDLIAELLGYALEGAEHGRDADQPALSNQVIRPIGDVADGYAGYQDAYMLRDGEAIWLYGETPESADDLLDVAEAAGQTETYRVWTRLVSWSDEPTDSVWYYLLLYRFESDDAAADWLAAREDGVADDPAYTDLEIDEADTGDAGFTYTGQAIETGGFNRGVTIQLGELIITVDLGGPVMPTEDAIEALLDAQLDCLDDTGCIAPIDYPADLADYLSDAEPDTGAAPEDEESGASPDGVYVSGEWGYTVTWDPEQWTIEETSFPDGILLVLDSESNTLITITGEEASNTDPAACVEETVNSMNAMTADELEPTDAFPAPTTADDAVGGVYLAGGDTLFYQECRVLIEDEAVLQIGFRSDTEQWSESLPILEELLADIAITAPE